MKTLVLFQHSTDNRPIITANSYEIICRTKYYLVDKWGQKFNIDYHYDKVLEETSYGVEIYGIFENGETLEDLFERLRDGHFINVITPFDYSK